jgi:hypothetical protein
MRDHYRDEKGDWFHTHPLRIDKRPPAASVQAQAQGIGARLATHGEAAKLGSRFNFPAHTSSALKMERSRSPSEERLQISQP